MSRVYYRKDQRGRKVFYIDYFAKGKRKRERVGYHKRQAEQALRSRETDVLRGKFDGIFPESEYTLEAIRNQYMKYSRTAKTEDTSNRDEGILDKHLIPNFGEISLNQITPEQVEDYRAERKGKNIAPATINKEIQLLKHIVKKAVEWGKIRTNLISDFKPLKTPPGRVRYLELEQIPKLMKACPPWLRPIVLIAMHTGMRRGEFVHLQRSNIDKQNRLIILNNTKNNERKSIPMNDTVWEIVQSLPTRLDTSYLFAEKNGQPLSANKVSMAFRKACKKSGITNFRLHDLRHHFASYLTMAGQNQRTVQELLGHKTPAMTARYSHLSPEHLRKAVEQLDRSFG
ncbi:MAG: tyrosine-type recombinase/integrase [Deltaproteobacteria bacterium]|nr:tyrosine-type recombinase/integrase [Deltaproteobacteria bacterium]